MTEFNEGLGIWQILNSNLVTDIISSSGFDLIIFDLEHGLHNTKLYKIAYIQLSWLLCLQ